MKRQIRRGVFETNSSSVHSITMCSDDEYSKWNSGELYIERYNGNFKTRNEIIDELKSEKKYKSNELEYDYVNWEEEDEVSKLIKENDYLTQEEYWDNIDYETFDDAYETKNGEIIHAFGYFGMDN